MKTSFYKVQADDKISENSSLKEVIDVLNNAFKKHLNLVYRTKEGGLCGPDENECGKKKRPVVMMVWQSDFKNRLFYAIYILTREGNAPNQTGDYKYRVNARYEGSLVFEDEFSIMALFKDRPSGADQFPHSEVYTPGSLVPAKPTDATKTSR